MFSTMSDRWADLAGRLEGAGRWLAPLGLRLLLAWEFWEAGLQKHRGENWFAHIQDKFPAPLHLAPVDLSWTLATLMLGVYCGFILLVAFAPDLLKQRIGDGVTTLGFPLGLGVILVAIALTGIYVWRANSEFDRLTAELKREVQP